MFDSPSSTQEFADYLPLLTLRPKESAHVLCVSALDAFYTHYVGRTRVCPGVPVCRLCDIGRARRYLGYFAAILQSRKVLVRLTSQAAYRLIATPPKPGTVYEIRSVGTRRPFEIAAVGTAKVSQKMQVSRVELLGVLMTLHGLGVPDCSLGYDDLVVMARDRAKSLIDHESLSLV